MKRLIWLPLVLVACKSHRVEPSEHAPARSTMTGMKQLHMRNCPSGVPGARTTFAPTDDGVELTITADDPSARARIVVLARMQAAQSNPIGLLHMHTGMHSGPGTVGYCPVIHADTAVTYEPIDNGVKIHVAARDPARARELQHATAIRVRALAPPSS